MDGNGLLKRYELSMEDKMVAGVFGALRIMGEDLFNVLASVLTRCIT